MAEQSMSQRAEALIAKMKAARGYIYPEWEFAARQDPEFVETYNRIYELGLGEGKHVSAKVREFVAIAVLETCLIPGGAPTFHRGLSALMEVDADGAT